MDTLVAEDNLAEEVDLVADSLVAEDSLVVDSLVAVDNLVEEEDLAGDSLAWGLEMVLLLGLERLIETFLSLLTRQGQRLWPP